MIKPLSPFAWGCGFFWLFVGFGLEAFGSSQTLQEANRHKILLISEGTEPRTLDPQLMQSNERLSHRQRFDEWVG